MTIYFSYATHFKKVILITIFFPITAMGETHAEKQLSNLQPTTPTEGAVASSSAGLVTPFVGLLIDEKTRDVFVFPPEALAFKKNIQGFYHFKPASTDEKKIDETKLNSVTLPLAERAVLFSKYISNKLSIFKPNFDANWGQEVVSFLEGAGRLNSVRNPDRSWPPPLTFSASTLRGKHGIVAVFTVRNAEKSGILEKYDILRFEQGQLVRDYWSRSIHDPALNEKTDRILDRISTHFIKQVRSPKIENNEGMIRLIVDKKISEKDIAAVEGILKSFILGNDNILIPYDVNRTDVRYFTPVVITHIDRILDRIKKEVPAVHARMVPGESGYVTLGLPSSTKLQK